LRLIIIVRFFGRLIVKSTSRFIVYGLAAFRINGMVWSISRVLFATVAMNLQGFDNHFGVSFEWITVVNLLIIESSCFRRGIAWAGRKISVLERGGIEMPN